MQRVMRSLCFFGLLCLGCSSPRVKLGEESLTGDGGAGGAPSGVQDGANAGPRGLGPGEDLVLIDEATWDALYRSACQGFTFEREPPQLQLELVVDLSEPMLRPAFGAPGSDWDFTRDALRGYVKSPFWIRSMGVSFFPNQANASHSGDPLPSSACVNSSDNVAMDSLSTSLTLATAIDSAIARVAPDPNAGSPIHDAYRLALGAFGSEQTPGFERYVALVTQGFPTFDLGCLGSGSDPAATQPIVDEIAAAKAAGIGTFVVGAPGSSQGKNGGIDARPWLSQAARAGGTPRHNCSDQGPEYCHVDMNKTVDLVAALRDAVLDLNPLFCKYALSFGLQDAVREPDAIAIVFTSFDGDRYLVRYNDAAVCDRGWHFTDGGKSVEVCGDTCWRLGRASEVWVLGDFSGSALPDAGTPDAARLGCGA
jgi:hypothetical protein